MNLTIKSRKLEWTFRFYAPDGGGYISVMIPDQYGNRHVVQICEGGGFRGSTLRCTDEADFKATCRRWYRQYLAATQRVADELGWC